MLLGKYRMLDLSRLYPGPLASHVLADMGMDVVKIEEPRPRYGMGRDILTPPDPTPEEEVACSAYNSIARNKRSVALDLLDEAARPKAREVFFRLVERADAVLEGYRPGVVEWLGVDYEAVRARNPKIVYCSISAFGQSGPYAGFPGHDRQMSAVAGSVGPRHPETGEPLGHGVAFADVTAGLHAAAGILAALLERGETGEGQYLDVSMVGSVMSSNLGAYELHHRQAALRQKSEPTSQSTLTFIECRDGRWLTTSNAEVPFWERFCRLIGREGYIPLHRESGPEVEAMVEDVREIFRTRDRDDWLRDLWAADTCAAPVNDPAEALDDPQVRHLGMMWEAEHPAQGTVRQVGFPIGFSRSKVELRRFAPVLGEHTHELLAEAGYAAAEIAALERDGVVKSWAAAGG